MCVFVCLGTAIVYPIIQFLFVLSPYNEPANTPFPTIFLRFCNIFCTTKNGIEIYRQNAFGIQLILLGRSGYFNVQHRKRLHCYLGTTNCDKKEHEKPKKRRSGEKIRIVKVFPGWAMKRARNKQYKTFVRTENENINSNTITEKKEKIGDGEEEEEEW